MQKTTDSISTRRFRIAWPILLFVLLFVFAIPWWWRFLPKLGSHTIFGAPIWFATAVLGSLFISLATAYYLTVAWDALEADPEHAEEPHRE